MKQYIIGWNRYAQQVVFYGTEQEAKDSKQFYRILDANSRYEAKELFLEIYKEIHSEHE